MKTFCFFCKYQYSLIHYGFFKMIINFFYSVTQIILHPHIAINDLNQWKIK
mgnify:CR=1 FL=1